MTKIGSSGSGPISPDVQIDKSEDAKPTSDTKPSASDDVAINVQAQQKASVQLAVDKMEVGKMQEQVIQEKLLNPSFQKALAEFDQSHQEAMSAFKEFGVKYEAFTAATNQVAKLVGEGTSIDLSDATKQMQEMNMSFNMQYLMLQQKMQDESRRFTLLSNIMKTKHDTADNSISNVR